MDRIQVQGVRPGVKARRCSVVSERCARSAGESCELPKARSQIRERCSIDASVCAQGRDCTEQITAANCHGTGTAQTEGLLSACSIADLRCVFFDHDEEPERQLYVRWRDFMMLALQLRNAFRLEFHDTPIGASMDIAAEDSELVPSARASTARCEPRPLSALEDGGTHRKFWR